MFVLWKGVGNIELMTLGAHDVGIFVVPVEHYGDSLAGVYSNGWAPSQHL